MLPRCSRLLSTMRAMQWTVTKPSSTQNYHTSTLPCQGNMSKQSKKPDITELQHLLQTAKAAVEEFAAHHPDVQNLKVLVKRIERDISFLSAQQAQGVDLSEARLQGTVNNLRGFHGEVVALYEAPGVTAVCSKFRSHWPKSKTAGAAPAAEQGALQVEVDLVAHSGQTWVEVKNQELFTTDSMHFLGSGSFKGLRQQVVDLLTVAASPCNWRRWCAPQVVVYFPSGVTPEVAAAVQELGAMVATGPGSLAALPAPHGGPPLVANLDVTAMCALVSEVTWNCQHPELQRWAHRTLHWQECLDAQLARPLLEELQPCLENSQQLVASCAAVQQFQKLMDIYSGQKEQQRWQQLQERLQVHHCITEDALPDESQHQGRSVHCGDCGRSLNSSSNGDESSSSNTSNEGSIKHSSSCYVQPARIQHSPLSKQQKAVFGLADVLQAVTLTANGNVVRSAQNAGVHLEAVIHRPVWLTGL